MKKSGLFAASVAAASATAFSASTSSSSLSSGFSCNSNTNIQFPQQEERYGDNLSTQASSTDKFAPRFDGLRFIETLVTAHR